MNEAKLSLNMGLAWPEVEHFYAVGHRGQTAGRIWFATDRRGEDEPWEWHLCLPMTLPDDSLALQLPFCFEVRALSGGLMSSTPA